MVDEKLLLEKLSSLEHEQWVHWSQGITPRLMKYSKVMYDTINEYDKLKQDGKLGNDLDDSMDSLCLCVKEITKTLIRWDNLSKPYCELYDVYKDDDRVHAEKVMNLLEMNDVL